MSLFKLISSVKGDRSSLLTRNILFSLILQGGSIMISLILLPISLNFVSVEEYGIWLTINSILMWTANLDLGLGSGLKNCLGKELAIGDYLKSRQYISTAYFLVVLIMTIVSIVFFVISKGIIWSQIFNLNETYSRIIQKTMNVVVYMFFIKFVLQIVNVIFDSMQFGFVGKLNNLISQIVILGIVLYYSKSSSGNLLNLGVIYSLVPICVFAISSGLLFIKKPELRPSVKLVKFELIRDMYDLGLKFFLIQLSMILLFQTSSVMIIRYFGPDEVVQYNIAFNLFSMITVIFTTISTPYWSSYINAWALKDISWIRKTNRNLFKIWLLVVLFGLILLIFSDVIYSIWLGRDLEIPFKLSIAMFFYSSLFSFTGIFNMFINATGKIYLQMIFLVVSCLLYFPILNLFIKNLKFGLISFPISLLVISIYSIFIAPIQYKKLINDSAVGFWGK